MIDIIVTSCYLSFVSAFLDSWQVLKTFGGSQHRLTDVLDAFFKFQDRRMSAKTVWV